MPRTVPVAEAALEAMEEQGGLKAATVQVRRNLYEGFKKWVEDSTNKSLEELFASKEGRDQFCQAFGRYWCKI
jgi:hypothetical protein